MESPPIERQLRNRPFWVYGARRAGALALACGGVGVTLTGSSAPQPMAEIQPLNIVAMGDSFTSGDGLLPYVDGTDQPGVNECHRSEQSYPYILKEALPESTIKDVACSGVKTTEVENGTNGEGSQLDALGTDTDVAVMTVGGNDEFSIGNIASICQKDGCGKETDIYKSVREKIRSSNHINGVAGLLSKVCLRAPNAKAVLVMEYTELGDLAKSFVNMAAGKGAEEMAAMVPYELNEANQKAIAKVGDSRIILVPVDVGLGYQTSGGAVFHPDASGEKRYADAALTTIRVLYPPVPPSHP